MKTDERAFDRFLSAVGRAENECLTAFDHRIAESERAIEEVATANIPSTMRAGMVRQIGMRCASDIYSDVFMSLRRAANMNASMAADIIYATSKDNGDPTMVDRRALNDTAAFRADQTAEGLQDWATVWSAAVNAGLKRHDVADLSDIKRIRWQVKHVARWQSAQMYNGAVSDMTRAASLAGKRVFKRWIGERSPAHDQITRPDGLFFSEGTEVPYPGTATFEPCTVIPWRRGWAAPVYFMVKGTRKWIR
jgi:hypothetical protein